MWSTLSIFWLISLFPPHRIAIGLSRSASTTAAAATAAASLIYTKYFSILIQVCAPLSWVSTFSPYCSVCTRSWFLHLLSCHSFCHRTWHYIIIRNVCTVHVDVYMLSSYHFSTHEKCSRFNHPWTVANVNGSLNEQSVQSTTTHSTHIPKRPIKWRAKDGKITNTHKIIIHLLLSVACWKPAIWIKLHTNSSHHDEMIYDRKSERCRKSSLIRLAAYVAYDWNIKKTTTTTARELVGKRERAKK